MLYKNLLVNPTWSVSNIKEPLKVFDRLVHN